MYLLAAFSPSVYHSGSRLCFTFRGSEGHIVLIGHGHFKADFYSEATPLPSEGGRRLRTAQDPLQGAESGSSAAGSSPVMLARDATGKTPHRSSAPAVKTAPFPPLSALSPYPWTVVLTLQPTCVFHSGFLPLSFLLSPVDIHSFENTSQSPSDSVRSCAITVIALYQPSPSSTKTYQNKPTK